MTTPADAPLQETLQAELVRIAKDLERVCREHEAGDVIIESTVLRRSRMTDIRVNGEYLGVAF